MCNVVKGRVRLSVFIDSYSFVIVLETVTRSQIKLLSFFRLMIHMSVFLVTDTCTHFKEAGNLQMCIVNCKQLSHLSPVGKNELRAVHNFSIALSSPVLVISNHMMITNTVSKFTK